MISAARSDICFRVDLQVEIAAVSTHGWRAPDVTSGVMRCRERRLRSAQERAEDGIQAEGGKCPKSEEGLMVRAMEVR